MIQLKLLLLGLTVVASIGYAAYNYYSSLNNEQEIPYSHGPRRRRRSSGGVDYMLTAGNTEGSFSNVERPKPKKRFTKTNQTCSICLVPVVREGKYLTCGHGFHQNCIQIWFNTEKTCPNCRAPVQAVDYY